MVKTRSSRQIQIRRLWPGDRIELRDHLLALSGRDRRFRFGRETPDGAVEAYVERIDWMTDHVLGAFSGPILCGSGVLSLIRWQWPTAGSAAIAVNEPFQRDGIGSALLRRLLLIGQNRVLGRIYLLCLNENEGMRALAARFGGRIDTYREETESLFEPGLPTPVSLALELMAEGEAAAQLVLSAQAGRRLVEAMS